MRQKLYIISLIMLLLTIACSSEHISYTYPEDPKTERKMRGGKLFTEDDKDIVLVGKEKSDEVKADENVVSNDDIKAEIAKASSAQNLSVNKKLWRASIEVVSSMFPISFMDSDAGLIVSDWGMINEKSNEKYKINVLVKGQELKEESLVVSVFKQEYTEGEWRNANTDGVLKKDIQEKILKRSREL